MSIDIFFLSSGCIEVKMDRYKQLHENSSLLSVVAGNQTTSQPSTLRASKDWLISLPANESKRRLLEICTARVNDNFNPLSCAATAMQVVRMSQNMGRVRMPPLKLSAEFSMKMETPPTFRVQPENRLGSAKKDARYISAVIFLQRFSPVAPPAQGIAFPSLTSPVNG